MNSLADRPKGQYHRSLWSALALDNPLKTDLQFAFRDHLFVLFIAKGLLTSFGA
jgi:hypothetical protein